MLELGRWLGYLDVDLGMAWLKEKAEAVTKQRDWSWKADGQAFLTNRETRQATIFKARGQL